MWSGWIWRCRELSEDDVTDLWPPHAGNPLETKRGQPKHLLEHFCNNKKRLIARSQKIQKLKGQRCVNAKKSNVTRRNETPQKCDVTDPAVKQATTILASLKAQRVFLFVELEVGTLPGVFRVSCGSSTYGFLVAGLRLHGNMLSLQSPSLPLSRALFWRFVDITSWTNHER